MSKYVVTGGAGFIGSNIAAELIKRGDQVKVIDNLSTGFKKNLAAVSDKLEFVEGDIRDLALLKREFKGFDFVLHQAALPSVPRSIADPVLSNDHNVNGTLNVLVAARDVGVKRVVYAASSSAYGDVEAEFKVETMPANPLSPYALTKYAGEAYCRLFTQLYDLETVAIRYFNVFGPHQDPSSQYSAVIPKFINLMLKKESPLIFGDGRQSRDFTYIANVVSANILAANAADGAGLVMNAACGQSVSLLELVEALNRILGTDLAPKFQKDRPGDVKHSKADISLATTKIGYKPLINFKAGLKETVKWYQQQLAVA
ncbi:SDR family oxidoreductase [Candidatus Berkelbacteria bacterium]|nr:SDR family oxidoreductase [Candidatus Berkelbacteria bacterium]